MTRIWFALLFITTFWQAGAQTVYPGYEDVIDKFLAAYSINDVAASERLAFEKRPDGWHVVLVDYAGENPDTVSNELFWNRWKRKYQKIDFPKLKKGRAAPPEHSGYIYASDKRFYQVCPYYGYPGWDRDVIREFENQSNLEDTVLYALGRAYSSCASNLLNDNTGYSDPRYRFDLPARKNSLTPEQLAEFRFYQHKAIEKFEQLARRNPDFETIIGKIGIKASNEYLASFLLLRIYQNEKEAEKELSDNLYNDFYIALAKNYLSSCAPHAILLVNGDNDTYPLLYVQAKLGFRRDVLVVNLSLLRTDEYINSLREPVLDAPGLAFELTPDDIEGNKLEVIMMDTDIDKRMTPGEVVNYIKDRENVKYQGVKQYPTLPTKRFAFSNGNDTIRWRLSESYFLKNFLMLLDLLNTNQWERPIYFGTGVGRDQFFGLEDYLQLKGLIYQLMDTKSTGINFSRGEVNVEATWENFMEKYDWSGLDDLQSLDAQNMAINYRHLFHCLASALIEKSETDSVRIVLNKCLELFPNDRLRFDVFVMLLAENYYQIEDFGKGDEVALQVIRNLEMDMDNIKNSKEGENNVIQNWLSFAKDIVRNYGREEILEELDK